MHGGAGLRGVELRARRQLPRGCWLKARIVHEHLLVLAVRVVDVRCQQKHTTTNTQHNKSERIRAQDTWERGRHDALPNGEAKFMLFQVLSHCKFLLCDAE